MKKVAALIFCTGSLASLFFGGSLYVSVTGDGLGGGYGVMFIGLPLILIGSVLFGISLFRAKR